MTPTKYENAKIYWDDQDSNDTGWAYRYERNGSEESGSVQCTDPDATYADIVAAATEIPRECGTVTIYRHESDRGHKCDLPAID